MSSTPDKHSVELALTVAGRASVWITWYFKRGVLTIFTAPLFFFLVFCIAVSAFGATIQGLALVRASYAVFGFAGSFIVCSFGWVPVVMPPILYYSLIKNLPGVWIRPDASRKARILSSLFVLIFLPLAAYLIYHAVAWGIESGLKEKTESKHSEFNNKTELDTALDKYKDTFGVMPNEFLQLSPNEREAYI
ncbi:MAG: hypothetical protein ACE5EK_06520, partial [Nitrospinales bacterium]